MAEQDKPKNSLIVVMVVGTITALVIIVLLVVGYFDMTVREEMEKKVYAHEANSLRDLHAEEQQKLEHYQWVSQKDGVVHVPVERAAELTLQDWNKRPTGLVVGADAVPAAGAPATPGAASAPASAPASGPATPASAPASGPAPGSAPAPVPASAPAPTP